MAWDWDDSGFSYITNYLRIEHYIMDSTVHDADRNVGDALPDVFAGKPTANFNCRTWGPSGKIGFLIQPDSSAPTHRLLRLDVEAHMRSDSTGDSALTLDVLYTDGTHYTTTSRSFNQSFIFNRDIDAVFLEASGPTGGGICVNIGKFRAVFTRPSSLCGKLRNGEVVRFAQGTAMNLGEFHQSMAVRNRNGESERLLSMPYPTLDVTGYGSLNSGFELGGVHLAKWV